MSVAKVNGHVVLPHMASWAHGMRWQRSWTNRVAANVRGSERRQALRIGARAKVSWTLDPFDFAEGGWLIERVREAKRVGLAAVPMWGYGMELASDASGTSASVVAAPMVVRPDDWLLFIQQGTVEAWDIAEVYDSTGLNFTLSAALGGTYAAGTMVWPVLFGQFECNDIPRRSSTFYYLTCSIIQLTTREQLPLDLCAMPLSNGGGDSFDCYTVEDPIVQTLNSGTAWAAAWVLTDRGGWAWDWLDAYSVGPCQAAALVGGVGWFAHWFLTKSIAGIQAYEWFDYTVQDPVTSILSDGDGWEEDTGWTLTESDLGLVAEDSLDDTDEGTGWATGSWGLIAGD